MQRTKPAQMVGEIAESPNRERGNDRKPEPYSEPKASIVAMAYRFRSCLQIRIDAASVTNVIHRASAM